MPMRARYTGLTERYRDRLRVHDDTRVVSLGEGTTPADRSSARSWMTWAAE